MGPVIWKKKVPRTAPYDPQNARLEHRENFFFWTVSEFRKSRKNAKKCEISHFSTLFLTFGPQFGVRRGGTPPFPEISCFLTCFLILLSKFYCHEGTHMPPDPHLLGQPGRVQMGILTLTQCVSFYSQNFLDAGNYAEKTMRRKIDTCVKDGWRLWQLAVLLLYTAQLGRAVCDSPETYRRARSHG